MTPAGPRDPDHRRQRRHGDRRLHGPRARRRPGLGGAGDRPDLAVPDETRTLRAVVTAPEGISGGTRRIAVQVRELTPPQASTISEIDLTVPPASSVQMRVDPLAVTGGKSATFSVLVENDGNTIVTGRSTATTRSAGAVPVRPGAHRAGARASTSSSTCAPRAKRRLFGSLDGPPAGHLSRRSAAGSIANFVGRDPYQAQQAPRRTGGASARRRSSRSRSSRAARCPWSVCWPRSPCSRS